MEIKNSLELCRDFMDFNYISLYKTAINMKSTVKSLQTLGIVLFLSFGVWSCGSSSMVENPKLTDTEISQWITANSYKIGIRNASPGAGNSIGRSRLTTGGSLANIPISDQHNFFKRNGESIEVFLTYFGTQQTTTNFGANQNIAFTGVPSSSKVRYNTKKQQYFLDYEFSKGAENFTVTITITKVGYTTISVNSNRRSFIQYFGNMYALEGN